MIKKALFLIFTICLISCNSKNPKQFSEKALQDMVLSVDDIKLTFREVLQKNKNKTILIDVWASWCKDCIAGLPKLKEIQKEFPEVAYVFLSVDRGNKAWKNAIIKYNLEGQHYNFPKGQKNGDFVDFINLWWIPRYIVINKKGEIVVFNSKSSTDDAIITALKNDK